MAQNPLPANNPGPFRDPIWQFIGTAFTILGFLFSTGGTTLLSIAAPHGLTNNVTSV